MTMSPGCSWALSRAPSGRLGERHGARRDPLASAEGFVEYKDTVGATLANFLMVWAADAQ
jgi:hypothetical protein